MNKRLIFKHFPKKEKLENNFVLKNYTLIINNQ